MKDGKETLRLWLTIILIGGLFIGYGRYIQYKKDRFLEENPQSSVKKNVEKDKIIINNNEKKINNNKVNYINKKIQLSSSIQNEIQKIKKEEKMYELTSDHLKILFSNKGGVIISNELLGYHQKHDFSNHSKEGYETGRIFFSEDVRDGIPKSFYRVIDQGKKNISFEGIMVIGEGIVLKIIKTYTINDYDLELSVKILNIGEKSYRGNMFVINGSTDGLKEDVKKSVFDITELSYTQEGENNSILSQGFMNLFSGTKTYEEVTSKSDWIALSSRFYFQVLRVLSGNSFGNVFWVSENREGLTNYIGAYKIKNLLGIGEEEKINFSYSFLPQSRGLLNDLYNEDQKDYYLIYRQFSFMKIISDSLYFMIEKLYDLTHNYGLTIILVTILIKLLFFPLTQKSYKSMQKMQKIAPKIKELRSKYKNNPTKLNMEMMSLYKKEDVNMMMGCLPMLLPIPIFIALYMLFRNMFELEGVRFLWISNLAEPDAIISWEKSIPLIGTSVQVIPFLLLISQIIQNKYTNYNNPAAGMDSETVRMQQMMIKYMMPIMFFIISWTLPSALTLYWLVQNIFTIVQSAYVKKTIS